MSYRPVPWGRIVPGIVVLGVAVPCVWLYPDYRLASAFTVDDLRFYEDRLSDGRPPRVSETPPSRRGKVLLMVASKRRPGGRHVIPSTWVPREVRRKTEEIEPPRLHDAMYDLDVSIRAGNPDEVGTVIFCEDYSQKVEDQRRWEDENYEYYVSIDKGRRNGVKIYAYDLASGRLLGAYDVEGRRARRTSTGYDRPDPVDLAEFVEEMPEL